MISLTAACLVLISTSRPVTAQVAPAGTLQGRVVMIDGQGHRLPVVGAHVVADSVLKETTGIGDTNGSGGYGPFTLFPTVYTVTVTATGFQPGSGTVEVVDGAAAQLDFTMTRIVAAPTPRLPVVRRLSSTGGGPAPVSMVIAALLLTSIGVRRLRSG